MADSLRDLVVSLSLNTDNFTRNIKSVNKQIQETEAAIKQTNQELKTAQSAWTAAGKALEDFSKKAQKVGKSATQIGKSLTTTVTTPILGLATGTVKTSVEFESAFAGVRKTVDASEAEFDELAGSIKQMSTEVAASTTDIASVVETAGQLGIENRHLMPLRRERLDTRTLTTAAPTIAHHPSTSPAAASTSVMSRMSGPWPLRSRR